MNAVLLIAAAGLFPADAPETQRVAVLRAFFKPPPGTELRVDPAEVQRLPKGRSPMFLRGAVTVSPPRGRCLTITRDPTQPDEVVCKTRELPFLLGDIARTGRIVWRIKTGDDDVGTDLSWPTPYRLAMTIGFDRKLIDPPEYHPIAHCEALRQHSGARAVRLTLFSGATWTFRFPDKDELVPQPEPPPNLYVFRAGGKISVSEAAGVTRDADKFANGVEPPDPKAAANQADKPATEGHGGEGEGQKKEEKSQEQIEVERAEAAAASRRDDRSIWSIPARGAYGMSTDNVVTRGGTAPGSNGLCRYTFEGAPEDRETGRIECYRTDGYQHLYAAVTCLGGIRN